MTKLSSLTKVGAVVASGALLLSACSNNAGGSTETTTPAAMGTTASQPVSFEYLHRLPDGEGMVPVADIVARWNAEHPDIQVTATKFDGKAPDLIKKVQTDVAANNAACLFQAGYADLAELYVGGLVQDVSAYASQYADKFGEGPFNSMSLDGKFFGLPQDTGPLVYYYNKAAFDELGLTVPTTAQDFIDTAKKAAEQGKYIVTYQTDEAGSLMPALSAAAGDQWFGIEGDTWTVNVTGEGTTKVADFWQQLLDAKAAPVVERWGADWGSKLNDGTVIGTIGAAWEAPLLASDMADSDNVGKWAIAQLPDFGNGAGSGPDGGSGVVVSKTCQYPAEAMEFNAWFNTQVDDLASQGLVVAAAATPASPEYATFYGGQDVLGEFAKANDAMNAFLYIPGWSAVWGNLGENSAAAGDGSSTVTDVLMKAADTAKPTDGGGMANSPAQAATTPRRSQRAVHEARTGWLFMAPFAVLFTFIFIIPILVSIYKSFFQTRVVGGGAFGGGESQQVFVGFDNFAYVIGSDVFWTGIGRVILYTLFQVPIMIGLALVLALLIDSYLVRHVTLYRLSYFLPYAVPGVVAAIIWMYIYTPSVSPLHSLFSGLGIEFPIDFFSTNIILASMANMTTWTFAGYNMLIFLAALQAIPRDLYEAARVDGASSLQIVRHIKVPMMRGAALLAILLSIVGTIQLYNEPAVLAAKNTWMGQAYTPMMMALNTAKGSLTPSGDGPASAIAIVMALIAGILAVTYFLTDRKVNGHD